MEKKITIEGHLQDDILLAQEELDYQKRLIRSLRSYLTFGVVVLLAGIFCIVWGFGFINNPVLARISLNARTTSAWIASGIVSAITAFSGYLIGVLINAKRHLRKSTADFHEKYPYSNYQ